MVNSTSPSRGRTSRAASQAEPPPAPADQSSASPASSIAAPSAPTSPPNRRPRSRRMGAFHTARPARAAAKIHGAGEPARMPSTRQAGTRQARINPSDPSMKFTALTVVNTKRAEPAKPSHQGQPPSPSVSTGPAMAAMARDRASRTRNLRRSDRTNRSSSRPSPPAIRPQIAIPDRLAASAGLVTGIRAQPVIVPTSTPNPPPRGVGSE